MAFLHAHPDDESIFTGGTLALLVEVGIRPIVILATGGEHGAGASAELAATRLGEARCALVELGVDVLHTLGYADSGGDRGSSGVEAFADADVDVAAASLAALLRSEDVSALVVYDEGGIYSHPDHLAVHRIGHAAARLAGIDTVYEATVDREYLHFVETHLVGDAVSWLAGEEHRSALNRAPLGVPTVEVTHTIDVRTVADRKRRAMSAHASQIPTDGRVGRMTSDEFDAVYGYEWFIRRGSAGSDDLLGRLIGS